MNFTPKLYQNTNIKTKNSNVASIQLEEKLPIFITDKMTKAPKELFEESKANFIVKKKNNYIFFILNFNERIKMK